jgi:hypothetical protein
LNLQQIRIRRRYHVRNSENALIREQPVTGIGLKTLETMLRTSRETLMRRADELGVSLVSDDHDAATVDTRPLRCTDGLIDPLLERLKQVHGASKRLSWASG